MLLFASSVFVCCGDDETDIDIKENTSKNEDTKIIKTETFTGKIEVENGFEKENVTVLTTYFDNKTMTLEIKGARFSDQMPIAVDMQWKDFSYTGDDYGTAFELDSIVPYAMGGFMEAFTCYNVKGISDEESIHFSFHCYGYDAQYNGLKQ